MTADGFFGYQSPDGDAEELWLMQDRERDARLHFTASRRRAFLRRMLALLGLGLPRKGSPRLGEASDSEIAIQDIAGLAGARRALGLPPMPQALVRAWREEYYRADAIDCFEPFSLILIEGHWYLEGGEMELIRIELARARSSAIALGRTESAHVLQRVARPSAACLSVDTCGKIAS